MIVTELPPPTGPETGETALTVGTGALTVSRKVWDADPVPWCVTVTVKVVAASAVVGVPVIAPVLALNERPVGSVPPLSA